MKKRSGFGLAVIGVVVLILTLSGCKTAPKAKADVPVVQITKASAEEIKEYGPSQESNPYMEPRTLLRGKLNEFFVVKIVLNLPAKSKVSVLAEMKGPDGSSSARAYTKLDFVTFWQNVVAQDDNSPKYNQKMTTIARSCIPAFDFTEGAGLTTYYLPFVGKNPIPRPSKVYVQVSVNGQGEPSVFTYDLVEPPTK
ncbi:MAG: hypothetical protein ABFC74_03365 [Rectinema sp.]